MARYHKRLLPHIPDDILILILLNLPARSLYLFRSVCKLWLRLIQSHDFIHLHSNRPIYDHKSLLILRSTETTSHRTKSYNSKKIKPVLTLMYVDETALPYKEDEFSLEALSPSMAKRGLWLEDRNLHIFGPCNGLFCVTDSIDIVVFNPVTRQSKKVPPSPLSSPSRDEYRHFDRVLFGFDSVSNDCKLVGFHTFDQELPGYDDSDGYSSGGSDPYYRCRYVIEIFSLSTNSWSQVDRFVRRSNVPLCLSYDLFFNGAFHWLGYAYLRDHTTIFTFNLNKEILKKFELPDNFVQLDYLDYHPMYLSVLDEYLTIVVHNVTNQWRLVDEFEIWVMKDYGVQNSWTKLYNISAGIGIQGPMSFYKDGEFLLKDSDEQLVSFNLNTRVFEKVEVPANPMFAFRYRESLVSPSGSGKGKRERKKRKKSRF